MATKEATPVASRAQHLRRVPLWSTGHDNWGPIATAKSLGFVPYKEHAYVILAEEARE